MQYTIKYIRRIRENFIQLMDTLSIEQLNEIPEGYNNNIIWNFGHIVTSTPALCYVRSGVNKHIDNPYFDKYRNGTMPESFVSKEEVDELKTLALSHLEKIEKDIEANTFLNIEPYATATFKYEMNTIEEILTCATAHESLHLGIASSIKRLVTSDHYQLQSNN
jgi:hypothetical protein